MTINLGYQADITVRHSYNRETILEIEDSNNQLSSVLLEAILDEENLLDEYVLGRLFDIYAEEIKIHQEENN